ncbi:PqqD family peptide modification chaperone [Microbacterium sp. EST19A]|uniref:PqqD family peptide modification chaperone n=1 Tax=Microbacterium sp. EST19A TaxID=2862681 RepID=UPI001CC12D78|nr:PqqD family peptide modification chaperone [Microbacterium sp. EST19A]
MPDRFLVSAVGAVIEVDVSDRDPAFQTRAYEAWADARYRGARAADAVATARAHLDDAAALSMLSTDVTTTALAHRREDSVWMLHAAGIADDDGHVVVLSAPSGTGKTTAARHLSQRYAYISDETIAIGADGSVDPYRKPLSIIEEGSPHKAQVALSSFDGGRSLPAVLRVAKIVVLDRSPDAPEQPLIEDLDVAEALELLGPQTSYLCDGAAPLQRIDALLEATGGAVRLRYREVGGIDAIIDALMRTEIRSVPAVSPRSPAPIIPSSRPGAYQRSEVVDELALDARTVVLRRMPTGGHVHVLDGIGPTLWEAADGLTLDEIVNAIVDEHGEPGAGDARAIVSAALQELVDDGLLQETAVQT